MRDDPNAMIGPGPASPRADVNAFTGAPNLASSVAGLAPGARAAAAGRAEILGAIGQGLAGRPYAERRALLAHLTPQLAARGVPAAAVADFDPTDANLAAVMEQVATARGLLAQTG
jgi:hypothetical protein